MFKSEQVINGQKYVLTIEQDPDTESPREWDNLGTMVCWHNRYDLGDKHNYASVEDWLEDMLRESLTEQQIEYVFVENYGDENNIEIRQESDELWYVFNKDGDKIVYTGGYYTKEEAETDFLQFKDDFLEHEVFEMLSENIEESLELLSEHYVILPLYLYDHSGITMNTTGFSCGWDSEQVGYIYASKEKLMKETGFTVLESEVETYDMYLRGEVYGYIIERVDQCECCGSVEYDHVDSCWGFYGEDFESMKGDTSEEFGILFDSLEWRY